MKENKRKKKKRWAIKKRMYYRSPPSAHTHIHASSIQFDHAGRFFYYYTRFFSHFYYH